MNDTPRIISLVPSWTETLVECDAHVVGRTRYCIHPQDRTQKIPAVGGTKDVRWTRFDGLRADLLLLDKEENPLWMAEQSPIPYTATHIRGVEDLAPTLLKLSQDFSNAKLALLSERWAQVCEAQQGSGDLKALPGVMHWLRHPSGPQVVRLFYVIWRSPWMVVSSQTFIGSVFKRLGYGSLLTEFPKNYPELPLEDYDRADHLLLFSTEPYDFARHKDRLLQIFRSAPMALVHGDLYSWFGVRSLLFLEQYLKKLQ